MNPWSLSGADIVVWGMILHFIADWLLQSDWMALNKTNVRHPAGYVHAGVHLVLLSVIFGWMAIPLAIIHFLIDTRVPIIWWGKLMRQTPPEGNWVEATTSDSHIVYKPLYDMGTEVRIWVDQVFHITCIAIAALLITL